MKKKSVIVIRTLDEDKKLIQDAAKKTEKTITDFLIIPAIKKAKSILKK